MIDMNQMKMMIRKIRLLHLLLKKISIKTVRDRLRISNDMLFWHCIWDNFAAATRNISLCIKAKYFFKLDVH
jgi:hypothetical protein